MRENAEENYSEYGHVLRSVTCNEFLGTEIKIAANRIEFFLVLGVISDMKSGLALRQE